MKPLFSFRTALLRTGFHFSLRLLLSLPLAAAAWSESTPAIPSLQPLQVVASIQPLALMIEEIAGEYAAVTVLVRPGQTPHDFAFKVSDRQRLAQADLLVWVGPALEPYLAELAGKGVQLSMASVLDINDTDHPHDHGHDHLHAHADQHFWLNPLYGHAMVIAIADTLARLDSQHEQFYRHNAERIGQQLLAISAEPAAGDHERTTVSEEAGHEGRYAVVHQAFDYFLDHFPYPRPMVLTPTPEVSPGARQLWRAGQRLQPGDCLMVESNKPGKWVQTFSERNNLQIRLVDIMGYREEVTTYTELLEGVKEVFDDCAQ